MNKLSIFLFASSLAAAIGFSVQVFTTVHDRKALMEDYAEINKVNYELFNIQLWKEEAIAIFQKKIKEYRISNETYQMLDDQIQGYILQLYKRYFESGELIKMITDNLESSGKINKVFINMIESQVDEQLDKLDLKSQIPGLSMQVVTEIKKNEPLIREYLHKEIFRLMLDATTQNYRDRRIPIYEKYGMTDASATDAFLTEKIRNADAAIAHYLKIGITLLLLSFALAFWMGGAYSFKAQMTGLTLISIIFLVLGVSMPMIDIDARLQSFDFLLMNEPIHFDEQVIYYQSKSILEVTKTLWQGGQWDLKFVGLLVLLFSVVFPFFKLLMSGLYLYTQRIRESKNAQLIIFHLGKWSMADVFVVAMFMAYIGFYGIISSQLNAISNGAGGFVIETVNYSRLSPGAFFFTLYTMLSITISILINRHFQSND